MKNHYILFILFCFSFSIVVAQNNNSEIIFEEQFDDNKNNWITEADETKILKMENGKYFIKNKMQFNSLTTKISVDINQDENFEIVSKFNKVKGYDSKGYGIIWGRKESNYYGFYITGNGKYLILKWENGTREYLVSLIESDFINKGDTINKLSIKKINDNMQYLVNDNIVHELPFKPFFGNKIGFSNGGKMEIEVDNLIVYGSVKKQKVVEIKRNIKDAVLVESFNNNNNNWAVNNIKGGRGTIINNEYVLTSSNNKPIHVNIPVEFDKERDFLIETNVKSFDGDKDASFCISWGISESTKEYYAFRINTFYGSYEYYKIKNGDVVKLINTTFTPVINKGIDATNKIVIKKGNNKLEFYINDKIINDYRFQSFFGNKIGYIVHFKHNISVQDLMIKYLAPSF
ncbi:MAG: hypothetical protein KAT68_15510 [Bacteroidales bacterium]|nr:hypothetical protein [Bacteroidales bacterium]